MKGEPYQRLCGDDRRNIQRLKKARKTQRAIAEIIGCSQGTISKELSRNRGGRGYRAKQAQRWADDRKRSKRPRHQSIEKKMREEVEKRLHLKHSPAQISGALRRQNGSAPCHETIYAYIRKNRKEGGDLWLNLRINGKRRYRRRAGNRRNQIPNRVDISLRPAVVDKRCRHGDWEVDLIAGQRGSGYLLSLIERKSRYGQLVELPNRNGAQTAQAIIAALKGLRVKTLTYDNGLEFSGHQTVNEALGSRSYFCQPYHSWEKGCVENFNGLVRQYFPKGKNLSRLKPGELQQVVQQLNQRPRKCLDYRCPQDYQKYLAT